MSSDDWQFSNYQATLAPHAPGLVALSAQACAGVGTAAVPSRATPSTPATPSVMRWPTVLSSQSKDCRLPLNRKPSWDSNPDTVDESPTQSAIPISNFRVGLGLVPAEDLDYFTGRNRFKATSPYSDSLAVGFGNEGLDLYKLQCRFADRYRPIDGSWRQIRLMPTTASSCTSSNRKRRTLARSGGTKSKVRQHHTGPCLHDPRPKH